MSIEINWLGTDGSSWDLLRGPVRTSVAGITGLAMPEVKRQTKETALRDGQRQTGWKLKPRPAWLPLKFKDAAATDVEGIQRDFWRSVAIGEQGTLTVTDGSGATRQLGLTCEGDDGYAYRLDPYVLSDAFGLTMIADQPWWEGPAVEFAYSLASEGALPTFFGNGAGATPFYIIPAQGGDSDTLANPGDSAAWIEWQLSGPFTYFRLGVDGHYLGGSIVGTEGQTLIVETDPLRQLALLDGIKVTRQLNEIDWAPIPRGSVTPVEISVVGSGIVTARITPRYARAF
jgi:hypothetical protein